MPYSRSRRFAIRPLPISEPSQVVLHWMAQAPTEAPFSALVKVRSTGNPLGPVVFEKGTCRVEGEGLFGVAPGQSAVFYDETGTIRCGGVIA